MGPQGGYCFHTLTDYEAYVPKDAWDKYRFGKLVISAETFTDWKAAIEKLCGDKNCVMELESNFKQYNKGVLELRAANSKLDTVEAK